MHSLRSRGPVGLLLALVLAWWAPASPAQVAYPPRGGGDFFDPCWGGPLNTPADIILDFGRSLDSVLRTLQTSTPQAGDPFASFGDDDLLHDFWSKCPGRSAVLSLGGRACTCSNAAIDGCDEGIPLRLGASVPREYLTCALDAPRCCEAADGLVLVGCTPLPTPVLGATVSLLVRHEILTATQPHLYVGFLDAESGLVEHRWIALLGAGGVVVEGGNTSGPLPRRGLGTTLGGGGAGEGLPDAEGVVPLEFRITPGRLYFVQLTIVDHDPRELTTPPSGYVGAGETESWQLWTVGGGGAPLEVHLYGEGGSTAEITTCP